MISRVSDNLNKKRNRETVNLDALVLIILEALLTNLLNFEVSKRDSFEPFKEFIHKFITNDFFNDCKEMMHCNPSAHKTSYSYVYNIIIYK